MNELNLIEYKLGIYDFKNSFIPFKWSSESSQQIVHVLYEWGTLLVFINQKEKDSSITKKILKIKEMDTQTKLKLLIQNDLYDMALTLASSQQDDPIFVADIFRKYADYLYRYKKIGFLIFTIKERRNLIKQWNNMFGPLDF